MTKFAYIATLSDNLSVCDVVILLLRCQIMLLSMQMANLLTLHFN